VVVTVYLSSLGLVKLVSVLSGKYFEFYVLVYVLSACYQYINGVGAKSSIWKTKKKKFYCDECLV